MKEKKYKFELTRSEIIKINIALQNLKRIYSDDNIYIIKRLISVFETLDKSIYDNDWMVSKWCQSTNKPL